MVKFIILKSIAGIGNRLSVICDLIKYALATNRVLIIDWTDKMFSEDNSNVCYKYFNININSSLLNHNIRSYKDIPNYDKLSIIPKC